ncbi:PIG-L family deacetylase [Candidatus Puniceispirillum sp.]|nr:PIG-L family deacetylase [Alphaproteobacteria bacterium]MDC1293849.1 PIG-L family deacetylase [Candidatus Puniceispirillum sp.]
MTNGSDMKKVAVIMAHPDDEVLGCGASIARLAGEGASVHILIMATGLTSRGEADAKALDALKDEAKVAANMLGAASVEFADFPDNAMDTRALLDVVKTVEIFISKTDPDMIFTHHSGDINIDHDITQRAVLTAARMLPDTKPIEILACEVLSSTEFGPADKRLKPNCYIRVSDDNLQAALDALGCYKGEIRHWPHPRSKEALMHQLRLRGAECGWGAAEVFEILRQVK